MKWKKEVSTVKHGENQIYYDSFPLIDEDIIEGLVMHYFEKIRIDGADSIFELCKSELI